MEELARQRVVRLFCGFDSSAAITSEGAVYAWGGGRLGQLGLGKSNLRDVTLPIRLPRSLTLLKNGAQLTSPRVPGTRR